MSEHTPADEQVAAAEAQWLQLWVRGPVETGPVANAPGIGDPAPDLKLADHRGELVALSDFWHDRPAVLLLWRQYGCGCGADRAARLRDELPAYRDAGAEVVVVGQAEPERTAAYRDAQQLDVPFLCDPDEQVYRAYGLNEFSVPEVLFDAPPEFRSHSEEVGRQFLADRHATGRYLVDNPWRRPGEFVVDTSGMIRLDYRWPYCEGFPDPRVLTTAITLAT
jgi:peroxiredoxin